MRRSLRAAFEKNYGYPEPTGNRGDGVNGWRRLFDILMPQGVKEYRVSFNEPIVTVAGNTATADTVNKQGCPVHFDSV